MANLREVNARQKADSKPRADKIIAMREAGKTWREIGEHFGVTRQCVTQIAQKFKPSLVRVGKPGRRSKVFLA